MTTIDELHETNRYNISRLDTDTSNSWSDASLDVEDNMLTEAIPTYEQSDLETIFDLPKRSICPPIDDYDVATQPYQEFGLVDEIPLNFSEEWLFYSIQQICPFNQSVTGSNFRLTDNENCYDPYSFLTTTPDFVLPDLSITSPGEQQRRLPITLVLDLDETLIHSTLDTCKDADFSFPVQYSMQDHTVYVRQRPHLRMFLEAVACMFEIIIFTAGQSAYAERLIDILDPDHTLIGHRIYRDSCVFSEGGYVKDLTILGRDLAKIAIVDNSPQVFKLQVENGIPIESWFGDPSDNALLSLLGFLETLVGVDDVRPIIRKKFGGVE